MDEEIQEQWVIRAAEDFYFKKDSIGTFTSDKSKRAIYPSEKIARKIILNYGLRNCKAIKIGG